MTEKRFTIFGEWHKDCVIDEIRDNTGEYVTIGRVVDLLNENEQLKKILGFLPNDNATDILNVLNSQENKIWELKQENEQLKSDLARVIEQSKENDKFLRSDIRILEKALWCNSCGNNIKRLKELRKEFL